ncbi:MAG: ankyrin repeat domain-containing protein [Gemmatimonadota bacterium]|nr:ankyrin repeat domain-containing protein [Gemmatimonadota bacterium]
MTSDARNLDSDHADWVISRMVRPAELANPGYIANSKGKGPEVWDMFCATIRGDLEAVQKLAVRNPELVHCIHYYTQPIKFAVREGHAEVVRYLLKKGASPFYRTRIFHDSLVNLAADREHEEIVRILEAAISERSGGYTRETEPLANELIDAVHASDYEKTARIVRNAPERVKLSNANGTTALHEAVSIGDFYLTRLLLDNGADIQAQAGTGFSIGQKPIHIALYAGWRDRILIRKKAALAGYLVARGADYNILVASAFGDVRRFREYLDVEPSLANFRDTCDRLPISIAAGRGHHDIVELLLENGADPNAPEPDAPRGKALLEAVFHGHTATAELLLQHGADPNGNVDSTGTAFHHARKNPELYELMKSYGGRVDIIPPISAAVNANDLEGVDEILTQNPEEIANAKLGNPARRGRLEMVKLLLKHGAAMTNKNHSSFFRVYETAKFLLENGANPNYRNWQGISSLHNIAHEGDVRKAGLLLDYGAEIDAIEPEYCSTPLGLACRAGHAPMVEFLLARGADAGLPHEHPWARPIAWAEKKGHPEIARILRDQGSI